MTCFLTCTAGLPANPDITPVYSCETDDIDVTLSSPFDLQSVDSIVLTYGAGDVTFSSGSFTQITTIHYNLPGIASVIIPASPITVIKFYVGADLVGTWAGSLSIDCGPVIESVVVTP